MRLIKSIALGALLLMGTVASAQFSEGKITAKQTFSSDDPAVQGQLAMLGEMKTVTYVKGKNTRTEQSGGMTGTNITIFNSDENTTLMLMDNPFAGKTYILQKGESEEDEAETEEDEDVDVEKTDETKEILGHNCVKYIVSTEEADVVMWVTTDIQVEGSDEKYAGKIDGYPMLTEIAMSQMGMEFTVHMEVTEISEEKVDKKLFKLDIPDGYTETTAEELKKMGGM